jgi:hypothetical protein
MDLKMRCWLRCGVWNVPVGHPTEQLHVQVRVFPAQDGS